MKRVVILIALILLVSGCGTAEWHQVSNECWDEAYVAVPKNIQQRVVQRTKQIKVPSGSSCSSYADGFGYINTKCRQLYTFDYIPYTEVQNVDVNASQRITWQTQCTTSRCISRYGNSGCKVNEKNPQGINQPEP